MLKFEGRKKNLRPSAKGLKEPESEVKVKRLRCCGGGIQRPAHQIVDL